MRRATAVFAFLVVFLLSGCLPISFSGANRPTDHTFTLTDNDLANARAIVDQCSPIWLTDDPEMTYKTALTILDGKGVEISERGAIKFQTAFPTRLRVGKGFYERSVEDRGRIMVHEVAGHYCQMDQLGILKFAGYYDDSPGRWLTESTAVALELQAMQKFGASNKQIQNRIEDKLHSMPSFYFLMDISAESFEAQSRALWGEAVGIAQVSCGLEYRGFKDVACAN